MESRFRVATAVSTIAAGLLIVIAAILAISAVGVNVDLLAQPQNLITLGADAAIVFRWSWLLAMFGYHILLIPVILYLGWWLAAHSPHLIRTTTVIGLGYALVGAIGLVLMTAALPPLMIAWSSVSQSDQGTLEGLFKVVTDVTFFGLTPLTFVLGGFWWLGIGQALRIERPALGIVTVILGVGTLASGLGFLFEVDPVARLELVNYLLAPIWVIWTGWVVSRNHDEVLAGVG